MGEIKTELKVSDFDKITEEDMVKIIDNMMESGTSRLKIRSSEELTDGEIIKEYHHGRCDINSPWACGQAFDVLE